MTPTDPSADLVSPDFRLARAGGVLTYTMTRDRKLNAMSAEMIAGLRAAVHEFADDPALQVLVITAEGRYFTAGRDIGLMAGGSDDAGDGRALRREYRRLHLLMDEMEAIEKPTVLAAQGPCLGIGVEIAVSCDFRLASESALFGLPELPNLAVIPGSGGISRLTRLIGPHWARWLAIAGQNVEPQRAVMIGLLHDVYPASEFADRVAAFAAGLAGLPKQAVGLAKIGIDLAAASDRVSARDFDRVANTLLLASDDHKAKVAAFLSR